ncbi:MAG: hypothetical protein QW320_06605 [Ignisphaera sp.]|uniref:hypothetical protein n=1 Tax=Thermofilum sp. TaxID=1961369 RepID=UPI003166AE85
MIEIAVMSQCIGKYQIQGKLDEARSVARWLAVLSRMLGSESYRALTSYPADDDLEVIVFGGVDLLEALWSELLHEVREQLSLEAFAKLVALDIIHFKASRLRQDLDEDDIHALSMLHGADLVSFILGKQDIKIDTSLLCEKPYLAVGIGARRFYRGELK